MSTTKFKPQKVLVRHGAFWYHVKERQVVPNKDTGFLEERDVINQRIASQNDEITVEFEQDYMRGVREHAFWTDEELAAVGSDRHPQAPDRPAGFTGPGGGPQVPVLPEGSELAVSEDGEGGAEAVPEPLSHDLADRPTEDLVDWLMATGEFDGMRKPNSQEVVKAAGENPDLAQRLKDAEPQARGGEGPRQGVLDGLDKVIAKNTA